MWEEAGQSEPREDEEEFVRRRHSAASAQSAADLVVLSTSTNWLSLPVCLINYHSSP